MKIPIKKILLGALLVIGLFIIYVYWQFSPARPLPGENIDNLIDFRETSALKDVRAVYLITSHKYGSGEVKFFIGPKPIWKRLLRQDPFTGSIDDHWVLRWVRGEYPIADFYEKPINDSNLLGRLVRFEIEEGPDLSEYGLRSHYAALSYIVEKDGDLYEYGLDIMEEGDMYQGRHWQSKELKQLFLEIEQKYHLKFTDCI